jgi:hypothetical protein
MQPSDQSTRSSGPTQRMTRASQKSEPTSSLQLDQPASPSKLQAGGRARVAFLFGWGLTGSLPARQHHPASSADQNRTSGRDARIKQLCQSCNQSTPSVSESLSMQVPKDLITPIGMMSVIRYWPEEQTINALRMLHPAGNCYTTKWVVMSTFHHTY